MVHGRLLLAHSDLLLGFWVIATLQNRAQAGSRVFGIGNDPTGGTVCGLQTLYAHGSLHQRATNLSRLERYGGFQAVCMVPAVGAAGSEELMSAMFWC